MKNIALSVQYFILMITGFVLLLSCSKSNFLDIKPRSNLVVPTTITDFQALLENDGGGVVGSGFDASPGLGEISSDNYFMPDNYYQSSASVLTKNLYTWATDPYSGLGNLKDWNLPYSQILITNLATEGLNNIPVNSNNLQSWNNTFGDALFKRAFAFWNLAQVFCPPYDSSTAMSDLGLPLKLSSDINKVVQRSTVQQTYDHILKDLNAAINLVPNSFAGHLNRASKPGVYALLARVYQSMRAYNKAGLYADSSLQLYSNLIDYNTVSTTTSSPFTNKNVETIYQCMVSSGSIVFAATSTSTIPDSIIYRSYASNDLRSLIFFRVNTTTNVVSFKNGYEGNLANSQFTGITSSEMYLIRSECSARAGNVSAAMADLNALLVNRWKKNGTVSTFVPYTASSASNALSQVLIERRKELIFRGLRWMDLRRLNKEGFGITLKRVIAGQTYTLAPNSSLYTLPIPPDEIALSGIQQNTR